MIDDLTNHSLSIFGSVMDLRLWWSVRWHHTLDLLGSHWPDIRHCHSALWVCVCVCLKSKRKDESMPMWFCLATLTRKGFFPPCGLGRITDGGKGWTRFKLREVIQVKRQGSVSALKRTKRHDVELRDRDRRNLESGRTIECPKMDCRVRSCE